MKRGLLLLGLVVSVAFNVGFVVSVAASHSGAVSSEPHAEQSPATDVVWVPCEDLQGRLDPLRRRQAGLTRQLAILIADPEVDDEAIDSCLDGLAAANREVQATVVDCIMLERNSLSEADRDVYVQRVHHRLCDPWTECGVPASCCTPAPSTNCDLD
jgi:hypothetical protein